MMRRSSAHIVLLAVLTLAACQHHTTATPALTATASGSAIVESSGGHQLGVTGTVLKDPLIVQVNDDKGTAVAGAIVEFHGPSGVRFEPEAMLTDSSGQATTSVTLGSIAGRYQLSATTSSNAHAITLAIVETALGYQEREGSILADKYCSRCHDPESSAERVSNYDNLAVKPHLFTDGATLNKMSDADLTAIIQHGGPALNRSALMPSYGGTLTAAEVRALIAYTRAVADPPFQPAGTVYAHQ